MKLLIKNGRVLNPAENLDKVMDLYIEDGKIVEKGESVSRPDD